MQSIPDSTSHDIENDVDVTTTASNETATAAPAPTEKEKEKEPQFDTKDFWALSSLDKSWVLSQGSALSCSLLVSIASGIVYFTAKDVVNCDGRSPYSLALLSGCYAFMINIQCWLASYKLRETGKKLAAPNSWSLRAKESRRCRAPAFLAVLAAWQCVAAVIFGLVNHRTSQAPLSGWGIVPIVATIGLVSSLHAATYSLYLAISIRRSQWTDSYIAVSVCEKASAQSSTEGEVKTEEPESSLLYDTPLSALPAFDQQWLAVHLLVSASILSAGTTSSALLWLVECGDPTRKPLMKLSEESFNVYLQFFNMGQFTLQLWLARVGSNKAAKSFRQPRFLILMAVFYYLAVATALGTTVWFAPNGSWGLVVVKVQTAVAAIAFLLCSGYNFALMLKTNYNDTAAPDAEKLEDATGTQSESEQG